MINPLSISIVQSFLDNDFKLCVIPYGSKAPIHQGWNLPTGCINSVGDLPNECNLGLLHSYSKTAALDIDDFTKSATYLLERGINLQSLMDAPDAVKVSSGRENRGKLLYRLDTPLPSKQINGSFELRCATTDNKSVQDIIFGKHPNGNDYIITGDYTKLPQLPDSILQLWNQLLVVKPVEQVEHSLDWEEIESALQSIDAGCSHDEWLSLGMALHSTGNPAGLSTWDTWSQQSDKYKAGECISRWASFKGTGVTIATLYSYALKSGWRQPIPEGMFGKVEVQPEKVLKRLEASTDAPTIDLTLWPEVLANRAMEIAQEVGCDPVVPLMAGLAAVSAATDKRIKLRITDSWSVPPVLWLMTVGSPSDKKSPGSRPMFKILKQLEQENVDRYNMDMLVWKGKEAKHATQLKAYRDWYSSPEAEIPNTVPPPYEELAVEPKQLRLVVNDSTSQKIVHMAVGRERGFLLHLDEMNHWLSKLNEARSGEDRGCWIQGYESGAYAMDRVGAGSIRADNLAIAVYGNCQPTVFKQHMIAASSDGLVQRFIPIVLNGDCTTEWQDSLPTWASSGGAYDSMIRQAYAIGERDIDCSLEAITEFRQFGRWYHEGRKLDIILNSSDIYMTAVGKIEGTCARLALLLHMTESPHQNVLTVETMQQAIKIMKQFIVPSLRYCFMELGGLKDPLQLSILNHVIQLASARPTVTLGDLKKAVRRVTGERKIDTEIYVIMEELSSYGYVAIEKDNGRTVSWFINPLLADLYKDQRQAIINAKQAVIEQFKQIAVSRQGYSNSKQHAIGSRDD